MPERGGGGGEGRQKEGEERSCTELEALGNSAYGMCPLHKGPGHHMDGEGGAYSESRAGWRSGKQSNTVTDGDKGVPKIPETLDCQEVAGRWPRQTRNRRSKVPRPARLAATAEGSQGSSWGTQGSRTVAARGRREILSKRRSFPVHMQGTSTPLAVSDLLRAGRGGDSTVTTPKGDRLIFPTVPLWTGPDRLVQGKCSSEPS